MPRLPSPVRRYKISHMWDIHHEICRLLVMGMSHDDIAEQLGVSKRMVSYTANSPIAQAKLEVLRLERDKAATDLMSRIRESAEDSFNLVKLVMQGEIPGVSPALRVRAATEILDRAGYGKVAKTINVGLEGKLTPQDIEEITRRASNSAYPIVVQAKEAGP